MLSIKTYQKSMQVKRAVDNMNIDIEEGDSLRL